jgi:hypothetical protein
MYNIQVLDRVMARIGGKQWWTAIGTRIKAQRIGTAIKRSTTTSTPGGTARKLQAIKNLSNYSLCARSRFQLNRHLTWNTVIEAPDMNIPYQQLEEHHRTKAAAAAVSTNTSTSFSSSPSLLLHNTYQQQLGYKRIIRDTCRIHSTVRLNLPGHDVAATLGNNLEYLDSSGEYAHVPVVASLDLSSQERGDGLQYRVGLHQVAAPAFEDWGQGNDDDEDGDGDRRTRRRRGGSGNMSVGRPLRTSLHAQGAVAVEGEAYIWKSNGGSSSGGILPSSSPTTTSNSSTASLFSRQTSSGQGFSSRKTSTIEQAAERGSKVATAITSATAAVSGDYEEEESIHSPATDLPTTIREEDENGGAGRSTSEPSSSNIQTSLDNFIHSLDSTNHNNKDAENGSFSSSNAASTAVVPHRQPIIQMTADEISAAIRNSAALLSELKESVVRLTDSVQDGSLQRLSDQLGGRVAAKKRPRSLLLGPSFIKLNAAMGCLARMPLPAVSGVLGFPAVLGSGGGGNGGGEGDDGSGDNVMIMAGGGGGGGGLRNRNVSTASLASLSSQIAEAWEPYLKGTALRIFASAAVSGQFGRFSRNFLDFSAFSLRADVGLTSPHVVGVALNPAALAAATYSTSESQTRPDRHRAFALEGRGSWHSLSVSLAQQVAGPVRARCDLRFALDPTNVPEDEGQRSTLRGLAQTALSVRPCLLETVWGMDSVLPGTGGGVRVAVWWAPKRKEAMAELRLF